MVLIHKLDWTKPIDLTPELYDSLFKGDGLGWKVEQTRALSTGDEITEQESELIFGKALKDIYNKQLDSFDFD